MKISIKAPFIVGCVALFSSAPSFAKDPSPTNFVRIKIGTSLRPSLSADGTKVLYVGRNQVDGQKKQIFQMDRIAHPGYNKAPTVTYHIEFPSGAPDGVHVRTFKPPAMNSNGTVVATTPAYPQQPGGWDYRHHLRIFKVANNVPVLIFEKKGEDVDEVGSVRVSRNGGFVAYTTMEYLADVAEVRWRVWIYNVMSGSETQVPERSYSYDIRGVSDDGKRILVSTGWESESGGANLSVIDSESGDMYPIIQGDRKNGAVSGTWDGDGEIAAFMSIGPLVKGDTNRAADVYLTRTATPESLFRISVAGGKQGNFFSEQPDISRNGLFTAFVSRADNLRASDDNYAKDLYVYSLNKGKLVSYVSGDEEINRPTVSGNGKVVAFISAASNLIPGGNQIELDMYGNKIEHLFVGYPSPLP